MPFMRRSIRVSVVAITAKDFVERGRSHEALSPIEQLIRVGRADSVFDG